MTDNKQKAKEQFGAMVKADMADMFAKPLSKEEVDGAILGEVGAILDEVTVVNNITSKSKEDTVAAMYKIKNIERGGADLKRIVEVKDELKKAA
jgi:hypothetical protein